MLVFSASHNLWNLAQQDVFEQKDITPVERSAAVVGVVSIEFT